MLSGNEGLTLKSQPSTVFSFAWQPQKRIKDSEGRNTRKGEFDKRHNCFQNRNKS